MSIDFRLRDFAHPIPVLRTLRLLRASERMGDQETHGMQARLLGALLAHAYRRVPAYRRSIEQTGLVPRGPVEPAELAHLPLLDRSDLRSRDLRASNAGRYGPRQTTTSGTSGRPVSFLLDRPSNALEFAFYWWHWSWSGYRLGEGHAELSAHYFLARPGMADHPWHIQRTLRRVLLNPLRITPETALAMVRILRQRRIRFLKGIASGLHALAEALPPGQAPPEFRGIFSTGEPLLDHQRRAIRHALGVEPLDSYGHMERCVAIVQCPAGSYHLATAYGLVELVPTGGRAESGQPLLELVGTGFHQRAMPLIRYRTGDLVEPLPGDAPPCPCGRSLPRIGRLHGRKEDLVITPDGRSLPGLRILLGLVEGIRIGQIVQTAPDRIEARIVPGDGFDRRQEDHLAGLLSSAAGSGMATRVLRVEPTDLIAGSSGKLRPVVMMQPGAPRKGPPEE